MKKFQFRLQTVHNVREMRQEKEQQTLMQMQTEINLVVEQIAQIEKTRFAALENYKQRIQSGTVINPVELELATNHFASLDRLQREAEQLLQTKKQGYSQQTTKVAQAMREVKITSQLRENQQTRHNLEIAKHEQNSIDEIVSANYARQMLPTK